ncbi:polycomb group protein Psc-like [Cydia fagiglandana]|uniref:polycomb group protein Psc-like n=1 Tax=Cydia fagiglandana TaxID=1458189 RepID=UPI002FEE64D3
MVTSNKLLDKKVVKMAEQNNSTVVPQRTLLGEVNEQITCPLCRGYYIDATTIVECLHSFCRSCIIKHLQISRYCPVCDVQINVAKPNFRLDKALQDIVYKLVPGLFQKEMERRQQFYSSRPGPAASATPEQRGEDTERIIFSPEDVISFSLEYADATDTDSISSKSSDSNEPQPPTGTTRRFLQCPAVVNISHLKKFLSMKFDIDSTQFAIDILYKRVPLPDYYTLMDIAYIYNWKRNEPMRFFYQIIDYVAIRNRLFDINRKGSHFRDRKSSPTPTEDTNVSSPAPNIHDQGSEVSSGTDSPMPEDNSGKKSHSSSTTDKNNQSNKDISSQNKSGNNSNSTAKKNDDEVEKSQFLNSFELTAKSNSQVIKSSPVKGNVQETSSSSNNNPVKSQEAPKDDDTLKRKPQTPPKAPEVKRLKIEIEKTRMPQGPTKPANSNSASSTGASELHKSGSAFDNLTKTKDPDNKLSPQPAKNTPSSSSPTKEQKIPAVGSKPTPESTGLKRTIPSTSNISSPKRKATNESVASVQNASQPKTVSPLKLQVPKMDSQQFALPKPAEVPKPPPKRMPDLKPTMPTTQATQNKGQPMNKVRMDLLANNSDPTIDRSKILSQVKSSLNAAHNAGQSSGDPLKSLLLDSCKINIPSSLSITLTDQKLDPRSPNEPTTSDPKKNITNKNLVSANSSTTAHKVPSPPVHNYIEILKLPDSNPKKQQIKAEGNTDTKQSPQAKPEGSTASPKPPGKSSESSAKGPVPNLKPIADTKLGKQSGNFASPITFQQTFEKQLQTLVSDKKTKLPKNKAQVPKLVPATPKTFNTINKLNNPNNKSPSSVTMTPENKPSAALDLTTPHNMQSQIGQHPNQSRLLEKMQSIANLAATKQNPPGKGLPANVNQGNVYSPISSRPANTGASPLRIPSSNMNQVKHEKGSPSGSQTSVRHDMGNKPFQINQANSGNSIMSPSYTQSHNSPTPTQPSPRSQTRSPSSSPKLVIAEEKQASSSSSEQSINQSNQISSTQLPNLNTLKNESPKASPGPSKPGPKPMKPLSSGLKLSGIRQPITPTIKSSPTMNLPPDYMTSQQMIAQHPMAHLRHQMEMNWYKANLFKSMANAVHQNQHDFNNKDKQMSAAQTAIPFKSRKRTYMNKRNKECNENENILNKMKLSEDSDLNLKNNFDNDSCSAPKISRKTFKSVSIVESKDECEESFDERNRNAVTSGPLPSREEEFEWLQNFLLESLDKEESASLYVSGQPGTGKTATLSCLLNSPKIKEGFKQVYVNCTMMKSAASIYSRICKELQLTTSGSTEKACLAAIEKYLNKKHKMILLVLDEIDQLDSKRQSVLYTIFEWPALAGSRLVLVGVANALDLTERALPRLQARCSLRPRTLHFAPYTKQQIINIFTKILGDADKTNVFSPVALQMLAAKIAAVSGDMRRALDIGRRVIELAKRSKFSENQSVDTMMKDCTVTVELKQVLEVLNDVYGGSKKIESDVDEGFPMQQKLILCSLMLMLKGKNKDIVMGKLHDVYKKVAAARNIAPLDMSEMSSACTLLEARGALRCTGAAGRTRRLRLQWDEAELTAALRDKPLMAAILADASCRPNC